MNWDYSHVVPTAPVNNPAPPAPAPQPLQAQPVALTPEHIDAIRNGPPHLQNSVAELMNQGLGQDELAANVMRLLASAQAQMHQNTPPATPDNIRSHMGAGVSTTEQNTIMHNIQAFEASHPGSHIEHVYSPTGQVLYDAHKAPTAAAPSFAKPAPENDMPGNMAKSMAFMNHMTAPAPASHAEWRMQPAETNAPGQAPVEGVTAPKMAYHDMGPTTAAIAAQGSNGFTPSNVPDVRQNRGIGRAA